MSKKVTLMKQCGKPDCNDPKCPYIMVENNRTFKRYVKEFNRRSKHPLFTIVGTLIFLLFSASLFMGALTLLLGL